MSNKIKSTGDGQTNKIEIPDMVVADDGTMLTMSPIESPLSLARRRLTAQMINEQVTMIRAGMTPDEIMAFYEAKGKAEKKKGKLVKKGSLPSTVLEIPDLNSSDSFLPAPPPLATSQSTKGIKPHKQPSHFRAFTEQTEPPLLNRGGHREVNLREIPKPSHYLAFEEASQFSNPVDKRGETRSETNIIRTKTLRGLQSSGGPAPPHFLALEMESRKKEKSSTSRRRRSLPSDEMSATIAASAAEKNRAIHDKLNSLTENVKSERRRPHGADLSAEVTAFFAMNKKMARKKQQQIQLQEKMEQSAKLIKNTERHAGQSKESNDASCSMYDVDRRIMLDAKPGGSIVDSLDQCFHDERLSLLKESEPRQSKERRHSTQAINTGVFMRSAEGTSSVERLVNLSIAGDNAQSINLYGAERSERRVSQNDLELRLQMHRSLSSDGEDSLNAGNSAMALKRNDSNNSKTRAKCGEGMSRRRSLERPSKQDRVKDLSSRSTSYAPASPHQQRKL